MTQIHGSIPAWYVLAIDRLITPNVAIQVPISLAFRLPADVEPLFFDQQHDSTTYHLKSLEDLIKVTDNQFRLRLDDSSLLIEYPGNWRLFREESEFVLMDHAGDMRVYRRKITRGGATGDFMTFVVKEEAKPQES